MSNTQKMAEIGHNMLMSLNGMNSQDAIVIISTCLAHVVEDMPEAVCKQFIEATVNITNSMLNDMRDASHKRTVH